jgi:hypothetical protein
MAGTARRILDRPSCRTAICMPFSIVVSRPGPATVPGEGLAEGCVAMNPRLWVGWYDRDHVGILPFILADAVRIVLLIAFPALALFLPGLFGF